MNEYGTNEECVARGVAFLDAEWGEWRQYVDASTLNLMSDTECVWGQLAVKHPRIADNAEVTNYFKVLEYLGKSPDWAREFGFAAMCGDDGFACECDSEALRLAELWGQEIGEPAAA